MVIKCLRAVFATNVLILRFTSSGSDQESFQILRTPCLTHVWLNLDPIWFLVLKCSPDQASAWAEEESRGVCLERVILYDIFAVNKKPICVFHEIDEILCVRRLLFVLAFFLKMTDSLMNDNSIPLLRNIMLPSQVHLSPYFCTNSGFLPSTNISLSETTQRHLWLDCFHYG